ncbi:unnamed protein product [Closterium sp. NIES-65]|nr:unnamed protein product [Closterium sp. NIES-65]
MRPKRNQSDAISPYYSSVPMSLSAHQLGLLIGRSSIASQSSSSYSSSSAAAASGASREILFALVPTPEAPGAAAPVAGSRERSGSDAREWRHVDGDWVAEHALQVSWLPWQSLPPCHVHKWVVSSASLHGLRPSSPVHPAALQVSRLLLGGMGVLGVCAFVSRLLLGGMGVLGVYAFCSDAAYSNATPSLLQALRSLAASLSPPASLAALLPPPPTDLILLHISSFSRRFSARSVATSSPATSAAMSPCDFKLASIPSPILISSILSLRAQWKGGTLTVGSFLSYPRSYSRAWHGAAVRECAGALPRHALLKLSRVCHSFVFPLPPLQAPRMGMCMAWWRCQGVCWRFFSLLPLLSSPTPSPTTADAKDGHVHGMVALSGGVLALCLAMPRDPFSRLLHDLKVRLLTAFFSSRLTSRLAMPQDPFSPVLYGLKVDVEQARPSAGGGGVPQCTLSTSLSSTPPCPFTYLPGRCCAQCAEERCSELCGMVAVADEAVREQGVGVEWEGQVEGEEEQSGMEGSGARAAVWLPPGTAPAKPHSSTRPGDSGSSDMIALKAGVGEKGSAGRAVSLLLAVLGVLLALLAALVLALK